MRRRGPLSQERPVVSGHRWTGRVASGRRVVHGDDALLALRRGMAQLSALIRPTLGPLARTVAVSPDLGSRPPEILDDGATIARRVIELDDPFANMGAMLLRQIVWQVHERVGDGTATAAVLARQLMDSAVAYVLAGGEPLAVRNGLEQGQAVVLAELRRMARPIDTPAEIAGIVRGIVREPALAELIGEVLDAVGPDGAVQVKDGSIAETTAEYVEGVRWNEGFTSPYLLRDGETMVAVDFPRVFVTDQTLEQARQLLPVVETCVAAGERNLLVIAPEVRGEALSLLLLNRERGVLDGVLAVKAPGFGDMRKGTLDDLAVITGGRCASALTDARSPSGIALSDLGRARHAWATRSACGVLGGLGDRACLRQRIGQARAELRLSTDEATRGAIRERLGRLTGAAAILRVGGRTTTERAARKERIEAALAAGRAALRDGVVPGGGAALVACLDALDRLSLDGDAGNGVRILADALPAPMRAIVENAGREPFPIVDRARRCGNGQVYDVVRERWVDPWATGLLDPVATLETALEVAVSGVATALTTNTLIRGTKPEMARMP